MYGNIYVSDENNDDIDRVGDEDDTDDVNDVIYEAPLNRESIEQNRSLCVFFSGIGYPGACGYIWGFLYFLFMKLYIHMF